MDNFSCYLQLLCSSKNHKTLLKLTKNFIHTLSLNKKQLNENNYLFKFKA